MLEPMFGKVTTEKSYQLWFETFLVTILHRGTENMYLSKTAKYSEFKKMDSINQDKKKEIQHYQGSP